MTQFEIKVTWDTCPKCGQEVDQVTTLTSGIYGKEIISFTIYHPSGDICYTMGQILLYGASVL